jgi:hypothetical protein
MKSNNLKRCNFYDKDNFFSPNTVLSNFSANVKSDFWKNNRIYSKSKLERNGICKNGLSRLECYTIKGHKRCIERLDHKRTFWFFKDSWSLENHLWHISVNKNWLNFIFCFSYSGSLRSRRWIRPSPPETDLPEPDFPGSGVRHGLRRLRSREDQLRHRRGHHLHQQHTEIFVDV